VWSNVPPQAVELVLVIEDPDASPDIEGLPKAPWLRDQAPRSRCAAKWPERLSHEVG
jgi:hypothetical protein